MNTDELKYLLYKVGTTACIKYNVLKLIMVIIVKIYANVKIMNY